MEKVGINSYRSSYEKIKDLTRPDPWLYWGDLLITASFCYGLMIACMRSDVASPERWLYFLLCSFFVNRGIYFMHEVFHHGKKLKGFETAQNLLFGCVFKYPSYIHFPHHHHHRANTYGTKDDPEYDDVWIGQPFPRYLSIAPISLAIPFVLLLRFGILPFFYPFMERDLRSKVYQRASTFAMNPGYIRPMHTKEEFKSWMVQDFLCAVINGGTVVLLVLNQLSLVNFLTFHMFSGMFFFFNFYRALIAHKYCADQTVKTIEAQVKDSISVPSSFTDFFWAPLGLKYHSLHHYFPTIPYHNLKKAHMKLIASGDPIYRQSLERSFFEALGKAASGENKIAPVALKDAA